MQVKGFSGLSSAIMPGELKLSEFKSTLSHSSRMSIIVLLVSLAALLAVFETYRTHSGAPFKSAHFLDNSLQNIPAIDIQTILARCASLKAVPGPSPAFRSRDISDRYEPGTNGTWIKHGLIFTGEKNGTAIIKGDLLLDKGIVKAIGRIPGWMLDEVENLTTVDARGAWITPGLGKAF
jgi:hypothetical protein